MVMGSPGLAVSSTGPVSRAAFSFLGGGAAFFGMRSAVANTLRTAFLAHSTMMVHFART